MKTHRQSRPTRSAREPGQETTRIHEPTLRACESAADRIRTAGEQLAASWTALLHEISAGVSPTDLLRKRAWCNVLELRLREQAQALEHARHNVDAIWDELIGTRSRTLLNPLIPKTNFTILTPTAAGADRRAATLKKATRP